MCWSLNHFFLKEKKNDSSANFTNKIYTHSEIILMDKMLILRIWTSCQNKNKKMDIIKA